MSFVQKIAAFAKDRARRKADKALVRQMQKELPDMVAELDRLVAEVKQADTSISAVFKIAAANAPRNVFKERVQVQATAPEPEPFNTDACTILQNPMTVPRQPIRVKQGMAA